MITQFYPFHDVIKEPSNFVLSAFIAKMVSVIDFYCENSRGINSL